MSILGQCDRKFLSIVSVLRVFVTFLDRKPLFQFDKEALFRTSESFAKFRKNNQETIQNKCYLPKYLFKYYHYFCKNLLFLTKYLKQTGI